MIPRRPPPRGAPQRARPPAARSSFALLLAALLLAALPGLGCPPCLCDRESVAHEPLQVTVTHVRDGDTVEFDPDEVPWWEGDASVRFLCVEAPEVAEGECYADEATVALREMVEGRTVTIRFAEEVEDVHGRMKGYVFVDGRMTNLDLARQGYVRLYPHLDLGFAHAFDEYACCDQVLEATREAHQADLGGWSACAGRDGWVYDERWEGR